jgi:putative oxidoreductase
LLYVIFGWHKLTGGTFAYFSYEGVPLPYVAVWIAVIMELGVGIALILGFLTGPLSLLLALYTWSSFLDDVRNGASRS